jgi:ABC-type sugar transport system ATPase subunit
MSLKLDHITKAFDGTPVLRDITLEMAPGELLVLLGPSGCGKSTLLRLVAGLEACDSGEIYLNNRRIDHLRPRERDVALVFQNYALYPHMTIEQNLAFPLKVARVHKAERKERVVEVAEKLGLSDKLKHKPGTLSGGQRQRVALGRAIIRQPSIFLLDEPLSNLDADLRVKMRLEIVRLQRDLARPMIHVTHDQAEALTMADRIGLLNEGVLQQLGTPEELYQSPSNRFVAEFIGQPKINMIMARIQDGRMIPFGFDFHGAPEMALRVGIRPEQIRISAGGEFKATVRLCEYLGDQYLAELQFGEQTLRVARLQEAQRVGDEVRFAVYPSDLLLFDPATGARVKFS